MRVLKCILPRRPSAQQVQPLTKSLTIFMPEDYDSEAERESSNSEQNHAWAFYARARITAREPIFAIPWLWAKHSSVFGRWTPDRDVYVLPTLAHSSVFITSSLRENHPRCRQHPVNVTVYHVCSVCRSSLQSDLCISASMRSSR